MAKRTEINCKICNSFYHKTKECSRERIIEDYEDELGSAKMRVEDIKDIINVLKEMKRKHHKKAVKLLENMDTSPREEAIKLLSSEERDLLGYYWWDEK